jgi:hypothetical protein
MEGADDDSIPHTGENATVNGGFVSLSQKKRLAMRQRFVEWCISLAFVWTFMNWPQRTGPSRRDQGAGFPFEFWTSAPHRADQFDLWYLTWDLVLGLIFVVGLAALFAWLRKPNTESLKVNA